MMITYNGKSKSFKKAVNEFNTAFSELLDNKDTTDAVKFIDGLESQFSKLVLAANKDHSQWFNVHKAEFVSALQEIQALRKAIYLEDFDNVDPTVYDLLGVAKLAKTDVPNYGQLSAIQSSISQRIWSPLATSALAEERELAHKVTSSHEAALTEIESEFKLDKIEALLAN